MTPQSTFMITASIKPSQLDNLRQLLASMNSAPGFANPRNTIVPYWQFENLHVARFTILEANTNDDILEHGRMPGFWPATLCFIGDIDGDADTFLAELVIRAEPGLRKIFSHCEGFSSQDSKLLDWLHRHSHKPTASYVNWIGRTYVQIREEAQLHRLLRARFDESTTLRDKAYPRQIWFELKQYVEGELASGTLKLTSAPPTPAGWMLRDLTHLCVVPLALLVLAPLFVIAAPFYFYQLRKLETSDHENSLPPHTTHLQTLVAQEDIDVTNHFNVFGLIKPGRLRLLTIRLGLLLLDYTSRHIYKRGYLTRIQTIHFARWVMLDNNRRVYFASNYDGSAESYMDDFINKVAWGLNLVFSNGVGYPRTHWLMKGGALREENYKRTLRRNQLPSESWYKAFPGMTAVDMARNAYIRKVVEMETPNDRQVKEWLKLL